MMRDLNEFGKFGDKKRHSSLDGLKKRKSYIQYHPYYEYDDQNGKFYILIFYSL